MINKDHLKYEATTLTLGNISSAEQLVPPLSLWKGVPGAAGPCPDCAGSPSPALAAWRLKREGRKEEGAGRWRPHRQGKEPQLALLGGSGVKGDRPLKRLRENWKV